MNVDARHGRSVGRRTSSWTPTSVDASRSNHIGLTLCELRQSEEGLLLAYDKTPNPPESLDT